jgi:hypothetical protein
MRTTIVLAALGIGAAVIGTSVAPPATADNCQTTGGVTVCAQGPNNGAGQSAPPGRSAPNGSGTGCTNVYGAYQNCNSR